jgi:hypothetical protein
MADYTFENNFFQERIISGAQPQFYKTFKKEPEKLSEQFFLPLCHGSQFESVCVPRNFGLR